MSTLKLKIVLLFCLVSLTCMGQKCKYSKKMVRKASKHLVNEKVLKATKFRYLFSKFSNAAGTSIIKSNKGNYLALVLTREFGRRIDIMKDNPVIIQFQNNEVIKLYPDRSTPGKFTLPVTTEINRGYYKLDTDQLKVLAAQSIVHVKVYFTSDKVSEEKSGKDDLGTFFDYEILSDRYQSNLIDGANCMLQL